MSEKSAAELNLIKVWKELMEYDFISINDFQKFQSRIANLLGKCEELRQSRDNWRKKYEELKSSSSR